MSGVAIERYECCGQPLFCGCHHSRSSCLVAEWKQHGLTWELYVGEKGPFATVYENGVWFTWDQDGVGGENSISDTVEKAKKSSSAYAIMQGFVRSGKNVVDETKNGA